MQGIAPDREAIQIRFSLENWCFQNDDILTITRSPFELGLLKWRQYFDFLGLDFHGLKYLKIDE